MQQLTEKEQKIFDYISDILQRYGYSPSVREIQTALNIKSTSTVHSYLKSLEQKSCIQREHGKSRTLRADTITSEPQSSVTIPIITKISVDEPILNIKNYDGYIDFPLIKHTSEAKVLFAFRIKDDTLKEYGVFYNDLAIIQKGANIAIDDMAAVFLNDEFIINKYNLLQKLNSLFVIGKIISIIRFL